MAKKPEIFGLSGDAISRIGRDAARKAREDSRRRGLPVSTEFEGETVTEQPDGTAEPVKPPQSSLARGPSLGRR